MPQDPLWGGCEGNGISGIERMGRKRSLLASSPSYVCCPCLCVLLYILLFGFPRATCCSLCALGWVFNVVHRWCSQKSPCLLMRFCAKHFHCSLQESLCLCKYPQPLRAPLYLSFICSVLSPSDQLLLQHWSLHLHMVKEGQSPPALPGVTALPGWLGHSTHAFVSLLVDLPLHFALKYG